MSREVTYRLSERERDYGTLLLLTCVLAGLPTTTAGTKLYLDALGLVRLDKEFDRSIQADWTLAVLDRARFLNDTPLPGLALYSEYTP